MEYLMPRQFIPIHPCLKVALSVPEFNVYTSIIEQSMKLNKGYSKNYWSQATFLDYTTLGRTAFNGAIDKLINKGLVVAQMRGNGMRNCYDIVESEFLALHEIFEINRDRKILGKFFKSYWKTNRRISEATDEEIEALMSSGKFNKIDEDVARGENFKRYRRKTTVNASENDGSTVGMRRCYIDNIDNEEISGCNPPNSGESFQDKNTHFPDDVNYENKKEESGSSNKVIEEDMEKESDMFNLFDAISDDVNKGKSFLEKKKQKTFSKEAKANNEINIIDELKDLQYKQHSIPSDIIKELEDEDNVYSLKNILFYFSKKYKNNACVDIEEAEEYYKELRDDYFHSSDILLNSSFLDVFRHFVVLDDKVYTFYSKVDESQIKVAIEEEYDKINVVDNIVYPDNLKNDEKEQFIVKEFNNQFKDAGEVHIEDMNNFIKGLMKGLNMKFFQNYSIIQPRLANLVIPNLVTYDEDFEYWKIKEVQKQEVCAETVELFDEDIDKLEEMVELNKDMVIDFYTLSPEELEKDNIFMDIFNDFRITRRMDVGNVHDMATRMLKFALIEESDAITLEEREKLLYAISRKLCLEHTDEKITDLVNTAITNKIK